MDDGVPSVGAVGAGDDDDHQKWAPCDGARL